MADLRLPDDFVRVVSQHRGEPGQADREAWLGRLPGLVDAATDRWRLRVDEAEPLRWGFTALVVPVLRPGGDPGALKVGWPHPESDTEHLALRAWKGRGAVRLLAAEPADGALLLERLDATRDLTTGSVLDTSEALGRLLRELDRPAPPWAPPWHEEVDRLAGSLARALADPSAAHRFPRRMLQQAAAIARDVLAEEPAQRLVHTDLHQSNVLWRPDPGEWVAIDPKVTAGDPHWAVAPALWNRWDDALAAHDLAMHLLLRIDLVCDAAGLERDRARAMTILRLTQNALWALEEQREDVDAEVTRAVAVIKAMQRG